MGFEAIRSPGSQSADQDPCGLTVCPSLCPHGPTAPFLPGCLVQKWKPSRGSFLEFTGWYGGPVARDFGSDWRMGKNFCTSWPCSTIPNHNSQIPMSHQFNRSDEAVFLSPSRGRKIYLAAVAVSSVLFRLVAFLSCLLMKQLRGVCPCPSSCVHKCTMIHEPEWTPVAHLHKESHVRSLHRSSIHPCPAAVESFLSPFFDFASASCLQSPRSPPGIYMGVGEVGESTDYPRLTDIKLCDVLVLSRNFLMPLASHHSSSFRFVRFSILGFPSVPVLYHEASLLLERISIPIPRPTPPDCIFERKIRRNQTKVKRRYKNNKMFGRGRKQSVSQSSTKSVKPPPTASVRDSGVSKRRPSVASTRRRPSIATSTNTLVDPSVKWVTHLFHRIHLGCNHLMQY